MLGETTRIEWPETAPVIAIDQESATTMLRNKYANNITDEQMDAYNVAVDNYLAANGFDPSNIPTPVTTEPVVEPTPVVPEAPAVPAVPDAPTTQEPPPPPPAPAEETEAGKKKGK